MVTILSRFECDKRTDAIMGTFFRLFQATFSIISRWYVKETYPTNETSATMGHIWRVNTGVEATLVHIGEWYKQLHGGLNETMSELILAKLEIAGSTSSKPSCGSSSFTHRWKKLGCSSTNSSFQFSNIRNLTSIWPPNVDKSFQYIVQLVIRRLAKNKCEVRFLDVRITTLVAFEGHSILKCKLTGFVLLVISVTNCIGSSEQTGLCVPSRNSWWIDSISPLPGVV